MFADQAIELCEGESYAGQVFTENTTLVDTTYYAFFDSILTTDITVFPNMDMTIDTVVAVGDEVLGIEVFSDTTLVQELTDVNDCPFTVTYQVQTVVNNREVLANVNIFISPNPNRGTFVISGQLPEAGTVSASIYNAFGQEVVALFTDEFLGKQFSYEMDEERLPTGTYFLLLKGDEWQVVSKVVVME